MTTFTVRSLLPVQTTHEDMLAHCSAFNLTLINWDKTAYKLTITVEEDLDVPTLTTIVDSLNQYMTSRLITLEE